MVRIGINLISPIGIGLMLITTSTILKALPAGFTDELVLDRLEDPVSLQPLPDGQMLILQKTGKILITDPVSPNPDRKAYLVLQGVDSEGERGLLDIALDPDFEANQWFYVSYAHKRTNRFRIARFTQSGNTADASSEEVIWANPEPLRHKFHHGGGLAFGPDGRLYYGQGEQYDNAQNSQNLNNYLGSIIRINKDGSIPDDNPFNDGTGPKADAIWAYGLRNPYTLYWHNATERFFVGDVGGNQDFKSKEEINLVSAGDNFGWPNCEGNCSAKHPEYAQPLYAYAHNGSDAAVIGGFVYETQGSINPFPAEYDGVFFFADYVDGFIKYLQFDTNPKEYSSVGTLAGAGEVGVIVHLKQGIDGALYYLNLISAPDYKQGSGQLRRIRYSAGNLLPTIHSVTATPELATSVPAEVVFAADASDPESAQLEYSWDFGDGSIGTGQQVTHQYSQPGDYRVQVSVSDNVNTVESEYLKIKIGQAPLASIIQPAEGATFRAGDTIVLQAEADDPDGTLSELSYRWIVRFFHNEHTHPLLNEISGSQAVFAVPVDGHSFESETGFEITLVVTDNDGIETIVKRRIRPQEINLTVNSDLPIRSDILVDGVPYASGTTFDTAIHFQHRMEVAAAYCINGKIYRFASWSNGSAEPIQTYSVSQDALTITAFYTPSDQTCDDQNIVGTAPAAIDDQFSDDDFTGTTLLNVLANDEPGSGELDLPTITIVDRPANGTIRIEADGQLVYVSAGFEGTDQFAYRVANKDGFISNAATVDLIAGSDSSDTNIDTGPDANPIDTGGEPGVAAPSSGGGGAIGWHTLLMLLLFAVLYLAARRSPSGSRA